MDEWKLSETERRFYYATRARVAGSAHRFMVKYHEDPESGGGTDEWTMMGEDGEDLAMQGYVSERWLLRFRRRLMGHHPNRAATMVLKFAGYSKWTPASEAMRRFGNAPLPEITEEELAKSIQLLDEDRKYEERLDAEREARKAAWREAFYLAHGIR